MLPSHQSPPRNQKRGVAGHLLHFLRKYLIKYNLFQILKISFYFIKINRFRCTLIKIFTFSFRDPHEAAKREKNRQSVIACRNRKAQAEAAAAAKAMEDKEEMERKHTRQIFEIKQSMAAMAKKYAKKKKTKKRKHDTSSEDSSSDSDSEASGEVSLSSHSDKNWKKKKRHRRSPTPRSPTPSLTITKRKATSPPPHALTRTGSDHSELHGDSYAYDGGSDGGSSSVSDGELGRNPTTTTTATQTKPSNSEDTGE